ncbi:MAG: inositol monophosphatase family protein [Longimicrobiales bacterium]
MTNQDGELLEVAVAAALDAVSVQRRRLGTVAPDRWAEKGVADFVTEVDVEAEARIVQRILAAFPDHTILAEEAADRDGPASFRETDPAQTRWIIDPLDGTTNYLHRYPMYAVSIAVMRAGELAAAVVASGATDDVWTAVRGGGAFRNGEPIRVSGIETLGRALIGTGFPFKTPSQLPAYLEQLGRVLRRSAGVRRAGSAAIDLCHVASGWFDGFWELWLAPWDVAAGTLIVREAGGVVTRLDGQSDVFGAHGSLLAGNVAMHAALGQLVKGDVS